MTLNNWKTMAETPSYIFRWRSGFRRRRVCLSSLMRFHRQTRLPEVNLSLLASKWKPFFPVMGKDNSLISYKLANIGFTLMWGFRCSSHRNLLTPYCKLLNRPGASFSKVPKLFGRISGDIILFVSSKRRRLEAQNFAVIFVFMPFTTYEMTSFTE